MNFSLSTLINTTIASSIFICAAVLLIRIGISDKRMKLYTISFLCVMTVIRLFMPLEFSFTHSIYIENLWHGLHSNLNNNYLHFLHFDVSYKCVLLLLWMSGFLCKLFYSLCKRKKSMDALHLLPKTTDSYAVHALENCNARFRHSKPCQLLTASHISSPFIAGILSPVIVIPDMHLDEKEWEYVFMHELYHYYKGHLLFQFLMEILASLYFWNPLVPLLNRQLPKLYEFNADEMVCSSLNSLQKINYSNCLLKILHQQSEPSKANSVGISFASSDLSARIKRTIDTRQSSKNIHLNHILLAGMVLLFVLSYSIILEPIYTLDDPSIMDSSDFYYRPNEDGTYDLINIHTNEYCFTTDHIFDEQIQLKEDLDL